MGKRYSAQSTQESGSTMQQYQLGVQAVNAGQYEVAKQHFEYIIQNYPDYPGVKSAYTGSAPANDDHAHAGPLPDSDHYPHA